MASVSAPKASFVQFEPTDTEHCVWGTVRGTLPIYSSGDLAFQIFVTGTPDEISELGNFYNNLISYGLQGVGDGEGMGGPTLLTFDEEPERFVLSETQMLFNWPHGVPGFEEAVAIGDCFRVQVTLNLSTGGETYASNRFIRVADDCFTSVLEYGNDDDAFGFNYCNSATGSIPPGGGGEEPPGQPTVCEPMAIEFDNISTWVMPYTTQLQDYYGRVPTVQVWLADTNGEYVLTYGLVTMDSPTDPTRITFNFGGNASGIIIIK